QEGSQAEAKDAELTEQAGPVVEPSHNRTWPYKLWQRHLKWLPAPSGLQPSQPIGRLQHIRPVRPWLPLRGTEPTQTGDALDWFVRERAPTLVRRLRIRRALTFRLTLYNAYRPLLILKWKCHTRKSGNAQPGAVGVCISQKAY